MDATTLAGRALTAPVVLFLTFDSVIKLLVIQPVTDSFVRMGIPDELARTVGLIEAACLALYLVPRTSGLGAVLMTGFLGGAVLSHLRLGDPLPTHTLFPIYCAAFLWGGLVLRRREMVAFLVR